MTIEWSLFNGIAKLIGLFQEKSRQGNGIFRFVTLLLDILEKTKVHTKLCDTPWKFQDQKTRLMEIPHDFFLIILENSTFLE